MTHGRRRGGEGTTRAVKAILAKAGGAENQPSEEQSARGVLLRGLPSPQVKLDDGGMVLDDELGITWAAGRAMRDGDLSKGDDVLVDPVGHGRFVLVDRVLWDSDRTLAKASSAGGD